MSTPDSQVVCRRLEGRVAVVSGAASGLGRATALRLAGEGARVVCGDVRHSPLPAGLDGDVPTDEVIAASGASASFVEWDVADAVQTEHAIRSAREQYGRLDIVVANAGVALPDAGSLPGESVELWHRHVEVNLTGTWHTIRLGLQPSVPKSGPCPSGLRRRLRSILWDGSARHGTSPPQSRSSLPPTRAGSVASRFRSTAAGPRSWRRERRATSEAPGIDD